MNLVLQTPSRKAVRVADFAEASRAYQSDRDESGEGASGFGPGTVKDAAGKVVARVSYNGRVWNPERTQVLAEAA